MKHIKIKNNYRNISNEGLLSDIASLFSKNKEKETSDSFDYEDADILDLFFSEFDKEKFEFKNEKIEAGNHAAFLIKDNQIPFDIISLIEKQVYFLQNLIYLNTDKKYDSLIKEVIAKTNSVKDSDGFEQLVKKYKTLLENTPILEKINRDILFLPKNKIISKNGFFHTSTINSFTNEYKKIKIAPCSDELVKKMKPLIRELSSLLIKTSSIREEINYYTEEEDMSSYWRSSVDSGDNNAMFLYTHLLNFNNGYYDHSPYLADLVFEITSKILAGLWYWVRNSIVDLKNW